MHTVFYKTVVCRDEGRVSATEEFPAYSPLENIFFADALLQNS